MELLFFFADSNCRGFLAIRLPTVVFADHVFSQLHLVCEVSGSSTWRGNIEGSAGGSSVKGRHGAQCSPARLIEVSFSSVFPTWPGRKWRYKVKLEVILTERDGLDVEQAGPGHIYAAAVH